MGTTTLRNPLRFFVELSHQRLSIVCWVYYLVVLNFSSAFFRNESLAKVIFFTFVVSASTIIGLYSRFGFKKIMGVGHIYWFPLVYLLLRRINDSSGSYRAYLIVLTVSILISLVFDTVDAWKYFTGRGKEY